MLSRIFVDNYKCFVNFDFTPKAVQPLFGGNGTGKTTLFEVMRTLKEFVSPNGNTCNIHFPASSLTRWDKRVVQSFSVDVKGNGGKYTYTLAIEHDPVHNRSRIQREELKWDTLWLYRSTLGSAQLYTDDGVKRAEVNFDWNRSGLAMLSARRENQRLTWFKEWFSRLTLVNLIPSQMTPRSEGEEPELSAGGVNFASWYRHLTQERPDIVARLRDDLHEVIDGFDHLLLPNVGDVRILTVQMRLPQEPGVPSRTRTAGGENGGSASSPPPAEWPAKNGSWTSSTTTTTTTTPGPSFPGSPPVKFDFSELSDGQRVLIALYTVLHAASGAGAVLCLDEPANFVALAEIQPFLVRLRDVVGSNWAQVFIVSHHPESIDYLAADEAVRLVRDGVGPVRPMPFPTLNSDGLRPSELVARGWEGDE